MHSSHSINKNTYYFVILSFIIIGSIIYSNSLNAPFYFDDFQNTLAPSLKMEELSQDTISKAISEGHLQKRLIANISFALNYYLHGAKVQGYHVVNIAIHIINSILLFFFIYITLTLPPNKDKYTHTLLLAYVASLLWLVHPLATQSVTYIVQRMNSLAVMFYLLSMVCYIRVRLFQKSSTKNTSFIVAGYLLCLLFGLMALGSKEIAATLPILILLYEVYFFKDLRLHFNLKNILLVCAITSVSVGLIYYFVGPEPWRLFSNTCSGRDFTVLERLLTQFRVIIHYITLIIFPAPERLVFDYNLPLSTSFLQPASTLYSFISIIGLIVLAILLAKKERLLSFCILSFLITLAIESSVICLEIIFEHRTYLPSIFLLIFCLTGLQRITGNGKITPVLFLAVSLIFGFWTFERNTVWQDPLVFWSDTVTKAPGKPRSLNNLGNAYVYKNKLDMAIQNYKKALDVNPDFLPTLKNISIVYTNNEDYEMAKYYCGLALQREPDFVDVLNTLAFIFMKEKNMEAAEQYFRKALEIDPNNALVNKNLGSMLLRINRPEEALQYLEKSYSFSTADTNLLLNLGEAYLRTGKGEQAYEIFQKTLEIAPDSAPAHYNLGLLLSNDGKEKEALHHYKEAVRLAPFYIPALYNLGNILLRSGKGTEAAEQYQKIIIMRPEIADAYNNLGLMLAQKGQYPEAALLFQEALQVMPNHGQAEKNLKAVQQELDLSAGEGKN